MTTPSTNRWSSAPNLHSNLRFVPENIKHFSLSTPSTIASLSSEMQLAKTKLLKPCQCTHSHESATVLKPLRSEINFTNRFRGMQHSHVKWFILAFMWMLFWHVASIPTLKPYTLGIASPTVGIHSAGNVWQNKQHSWLADQRCLDDITVKTDMSTQSANGNHN